MATSMISQRPARVGPVAVRNGRRRLFVHRVLIAVFVAVVGAVVLYPILMLVVGSFRSDPPGATGASWTVRGWREAYGSSETYSTMLTTLRITFISTVTSTTLALALGWIVARTNTPARSVLERLLFAPLLLPGILLGLAWSIVGSPRVGLISTWLAKIPGVGEERFNIYSEFGLIFVFTLALAPLTLFLILPSLKSIDHTLEEAAVAAGAGRAQAALRVTLPMIAPAVLGGAILSAIRVMESLELPALLGQPAGIRVFMTQIFFSMRYTPLPDYAEATALAVAIVAITATLVVLQARFLRKRSYITVGSRGASSDVTDLGRWRFATGAFCWFYLLLTVALPVAVLVIGTFENFIGLYEWNELTLENWRGVLDDRHFRSALWNTITISLSAAVLVSFVSGILSYLIVRSKSRFRWVLDGISWLPWSLPGVVLGVGLLWAYSLAPGGLYATKWVLVIGYVTVLLPLGVRQYTAALRQIDPQLEEAALVAGSRHLRLATRIIVPLLLKSVIATLLFGFVLGVREVGMPALLVRPGNEVLGSLTLYSWIDGKANEAAVYGVVMLGLSLIAIALLGLVELVLGRAQRSVGTPVPRANRASAAPSTPPSG